MGKTVNIIGNKYGKLTVVIQTRIVGKNSYYLCQCDCGGEKEVQRSHLISGDTTHCGCDKSNDGRSNRLIDLMGQRFGRLLVISRAENNKYHEPTWRCKCDCGNTKIVEGAVLKRGDTQSCGCLVRNVFTQHGMYKSRLHKEWRGMKHRCKNPSASHYECYGGKGIKVCDEWQEFIPFMEWALNNGYSDELEIDRIDNDGNYEPSNCRWITHQQNCWNRGNGQIAEKSAENKRKITVPGIKGVQLRMERKTPKYRATITVNGKNISLGQYFDVNDAINARMQGELKYWGWTEIANPSERG